LRLKLGKASALENNKTQTGSPKETLRLKLGRASALENIFISVSVTGGAIKGSRRSSLRVRKDSSLRPFWSRRPLEDSESVGERERERERETRSPVKLSCSSDVQKRNAGRPWSECSLLSRTKFGNGCLSVVSKLERVRCRASGSRIRATDSC